MAPNGGHQGGYQSDISSRNDENNRYDFYVSQKKKILHIENLRRSTHEVWTLRSLPQHVCIMIMLLYLIISHMFLHVTRVCNNALSYYKLWSYWSYCVMCTSNININLDVLGTAGVPNVILNSLPAFDTMWCHRSRSTLVHVMACCQMAPSHCLNHCWLLTNGVLWHSADQFHSKCSIPNMDLKIMLLILQPHFSGANELKYCHFFVNSHPPFEHCCQITKSIFGIIDSQINFFEKIIYLTLLWALWPLMAQPCRVLGYQVTWCASIDGQLCVTCNTHTTYTHTHTHTTDLGPAIKGKKTQVKSNWSNKF